MLAASLAMMPACAHSPASPVGPAADPVIETRTVTVPVCPAELAAPVSAAPAVPAGARLEGNDAGMAWLTRFTAWARALADRLTDAAAACEESGA